MKSRWQPDDFRRDVHAIRGDVQQLKTDLAAAMRDLISAGRGGLGEGRERLREEVQQKLDALNRAACGWGGGLGEGLGEYGRHAAERVRREVKDNPARTAAIVLGLGAVLGMLLISGRRR